MDLDNLIKYMEDIKSEVEIDDNQDLIPLVTKMARKINEVRFWIYSESMKNRKNGADPRLTKIDPKIKELVISRIEYIIESLNVVACSMGYQKYKGACMTYHQTIQGFKSSIGEDWVQFFIILKIPTINNWKSFSEKLSY